MEHRVSPTLRVWQLAESLRSYREKSGLTIEEAAAELRARSPRWSKSKVQRVESRQYTPKPGEVENFGPVYQIPDDQLATLVTMSEQARQRGWWVSSALPKQGYTLVGLEQAATGLRQFELALVPGLLQTSEYARALMQAIEPSTSPEELENLVAARMVRQQALRREVPVPLHVVLSEAVLRAPVGGQRVMRGQLEYLLEAVAELGVHLQVLPLARGPHPGMEGAFTLFTLPGMTLDVGYVEGIAGSLWLEGPEDVRRCTMRFEVLSTTALSESSSADLISTTLAEYR